MSRGFVKEGDQEQVPMVPARAYLPEGVTNYVTPTGMDELLAEKEKLMSEKDKLHYNNENERRIAINHINARLQLLNNRIDSAVVVHPDEGAEIEVTFGACVTLKIGKLAKTKTFRIVGVDEADVSKGKISFISPLANELINKKVGDKVVLKRPDRDITYEIMQISYPSE